jgi:hypothetical protein
MSSDRWMEIAHMFGIASLLLYRIEEEDNGFSEVFSEKEVERGE